MPLSSPNAERLLKSVEVFPNQGGGFGHGVTKRLSMPEGYDRTINMATRDGDVFAPAFRSVAGVTSDSVHPSFAVAWRDASAVPVPQFIAGVGASLSWIQAGLSFSAVFPGATAQLYGAAFHDDGGGVEYLYVGRDPALSYLSWRSQAGTMSEAVNPQTVKVKYLVSAAGSLWRTINDYQISKCPSGSNPQLLASWGAAIAVGTNYGTITALGAIGSAPVVFKTDGIYVYIEADTRFENQFPVDPNADNFPFVRSDGMGGIFSAMHDGSIVHITRGGSITVEHPLKGKTPQRDTPRGPITDIAIWGDRVFAMMGAGYRMVRPPGLVVWKTADNFATFTDYSAAVVDPNPATVADISSLPNDAGGGRLLIGFDQPFCAVQFLMQQFNSSVVNNITVYTSRAGNTWISESANTGTMKDLGSHAFGSSGIVGLQLTADIANWARITLGGGGTGVSAKTKYWIALSVTVAMPVSVQIGSMGIVVQRVAPTFNASGVVPFGAAFEASAHCVKVLVGTWKRGAIVWDDLWTVYGQATTGKLSITSLPLPNSPNASLVAITESGAQQWPLPNILEPTIVDYPNLANDPPSSTGIAPVLYPSAVDLETIHIVRYIEIIGQNLVEGVDSWAVAWRWDDRMAWDNDKTGAGDQNATNALFEVSDGVGGRVLHTAIQLIDANNTDAVAPSGVRVIFWCEAVPVRSSQQVEPVRGTVEVA